jgi:hypothetical protein
MEVALQDDSVFLNQTVWNREIGLQKAREMGVTRLRVNLQWSKVLGAQAHTRKAPKVLNYDFVAFDALIDHARAHGIKIQLTVTGPAPAWATKNRKVGPYKPRAPRYAAFVRAVAKHFKGRVDRYSIWNEPNWPGWLAPQKQRGRVTGAKLYRALYIAGYRSIKKVDRNAQVLIGELAPEERKGKSIAPLTFMRKVATVRGRTLRADGLAHHPYTIKAPPERRSHGRNDVGMGSLGRMTKLLNQLNRQRRLRGPRGRPLDLYLTEFGYFASGPRALPPAQAADYLRRGFEMAHRNPRVKQMLQYMLMQPAAGTPWDTGIIRPDGTPSPMFDVLRNWAQASIAQGSIAR